MSTSIQEPKASSSQEHLPTSPTRRKRSQVSRACDWCRVHRIKCDSHLPCSNCKKRGGQCFSDGTPKVATLPHAYREIEGLRYRIQELEHEIQKWREITAPAAVLDGHQLSMPASSSSSMLCDNDGINGSISNGKVAMSRLWEGIHIGTAQSPGKIWYGSSSLLYFVGRMNTYLSTVLNQAHPGHRVLPNPAGKLLDEQATLSPYGQDQNRSLLPLEGKALYSGDYLTPTQEEYFLDLFWQSYHISYPILDEADFKEYYQSLWSTSGKERKPSALVDIMLALCMQYGMVLEAGGRRGTKGASEASMRNNDATVAGLWHYRRCQTLLLYDSENPTISTLQCHILCSIYLCCASFQNMADSTCSLAVSTAHMLGLHLEPPDALSRRESQMRKRIWWALYVLDSKMSLKLGRPFLLHGFDATCTLPADDRETAMVSGSTFAPPGENATWLTCQLHSIKLMMAVRAAHAAFYRADLNASDMRNGPTIWYNPQALEAHADLLERHMNRLEEWVDGVPSVLTTSRHGNSSPFSTDISALEIEQFAPVWLQRQRLLLELLYHNLCINLYRPFISFVPETASRRSVEEKAMRCVAHAMILTHMMHQVLSSTSILAGWHEAFQWQWNAAMTLVGSVLAYPQNTSTRQARIAIYLSIAVLENFGEKLSIAVNAANIVRDISAKFDVLTEQNHGTGNILLNTSSNDTQLDFSRNETGDGNYLNGDDLTAQTIFGFPGFDEDTISAVQDALGRSDDINQARETYNELDNNFGTLWSTISSSFADY
ncbi:fungal-specific transcription factor domain-containing protein [Xylariaceae sp. FL0662B]|nr:fungal-specific transcription factor domain-containing protein [Xylariaceae sp. FL0662B]